MALVTLADYKLAIGETDASKDAYHQLALDAAEAAVLSYSDRDFGAANVTETRSYSYNGGGVLNIDECTAITSVQVAGHALLSTGWIAKSDGPAGAPYSWLRMPIIDWTNAAQSLGAMGFLQNLDRFYLTGGFDEIAVQVTATFGWPGVPADIQRAVIWTAKNYEDTDNTGGEGGDVASRSVAEVAESYFQQQLQQIGQGEPPALPERAKAIIDNYRRISL